MQDRTKVALIVLDKCNLRAIEREDGRGVHRPITGGIGERECRVSIFACGIGVPSEPFGGKNISQSKFLEAQFHYNPLQLGVLLLQFLQALLRF